MKAQLGRPTGLALALLATLLATLFAMSVFSVALAQQPTSPARSFSPTTVKSGGTLVVTITVPDYQRSVLVMDTLPEGFVFQPGSGEYREDERKVEFLIVQLTPGTQKVTSASYMVTAPTVTGVHTFDGGSYIVDSGASMDIPDSTVTVAAATNGGNGEYNLAADSTTPGSNESLVLKSTIDLNNTDNIIVKLDTFGVPGSIDTSDVRISLTGAAAGSGFPSDIEVDGTTVTLVGPVVDGNGDDVGSADHTGATITFRRGAGITLPIRDGDYDVEVENEDGDDDGVVNRVNVRREVSVSPKSGKRGTEITISGKGFADGTAAIKIGDRAAFTTAEVDDGAFSLTVDSAAKVNDVNVFGVEKTLINASDAVGNVAEPENGAEFEILPSFTVSPENPLSGADITITLVDVTVGESIPMVSFAGGTASPASPVTTTTTSNDWKATVPDTARIGTIQVKVSVGDTDLTQNITIGTNDLTITPTTVVPRQEISIDGGGFTSRDVATTTKKENTIGVDAVMFGETAATHSEQLVNNSGNISFNVQVPDSATPGTVRVSVQDEGGRIGVATITVSKPNITLDPAESLIGSQVTVSGTGFPANDLVLIKYGGNTVETSATTSTGTFEKTITVPSGNDPGATPTVEAVAQVQDVDPDAKASATTDHTLPDAAITLSPSEAAAGSTLTINGANYKGFLQVYRIEIGGQNVTPVPAPSTDKWGTFSTTVQVPQLTPGRYAVSVRVGDETGDSATEFLQVVTETVVVLTDPADVFASLIDAGSLSRVWHLNAALQTSDPGNAWTFYDPNPDLADFNKLTEIQRDQSYVLIMTAEGEFSGKPLYSGTNFVFIP